ncbi:hypothetical protein LshimejAT787_1402510 [Lyophyllum shimeji]|uniref:Uncharacterized protein n=1 Tax=Lyophyllum shimeji TaxID=47721 RepID=A0A9P3PYD4_LYOSH|nr:hypothetical protein LshimejAT787_1402510 [Lyophyllum shimeji]
MLRTPNAGQALVGATPQADRLVLFSAADAYDLVSSSPLQGAWRVYLIWENFAWSKRGVGSGHRLPCYLIYVPPRSSPRVFTQRPPGPGRQPSPHHLTLSFGRPSPGQERSSPPFIATALAWECQPAARNVGLLCCDVEKGTQ